MSTRVVFPRSRGVKGTHPLFVSFKGRGRAGVVNICLKPSRDAGSKQDFKDLHRDEMRERRARYRADKRGPDKAKARHSRFAKWFDRSWKQQNVEWRSKSIWPDGKVAKPGRMG